MDWLLFLIFFAACGAGGATGMLFKPGDWYEALEKPEWTPPNWAFPVAWGILYLFIASAAASAAVMPGNALGMAFWSMQIALNVLWTPVFFGLHRVRAALIVMGALWIAVFGATVSFFFLSIGAGVMMLPYLLWISFAAYLNYMIWQANGDTPELTAEEE